MFDLIFKIIIYTFLLGAIGIGCYLLVSPNLRFVQQRYDRLQKLDGYQHFLLKIRKFLELSIGKNSLTAAYVFIVGLVTVFLLIFLGLILNGFGLILSLLLPLSIAWGILYLFMLLGYRNKVVITHEGIILAQELLSNYKIYSRNIYEAIEQTANSLSVEQAPLSKKMMKNLSYNLRQARNDSAVIESLHQMFYLMDVSWSYSLSTIIQKAILDGLDIEDSLKDIIQDLEELENLKHDLKDEIYEAKIMLKVLAPVMVIVTLYVLTVVFGATLLEYINYQFGSGFIYMVIIIILFLISVGLYLYVSRQKNDF